METYFLLFSGRPQIAQEILDCFVAIAKQYRAKCIFTELVPLDGYGVGPCLLVYVLFSCDPATMEDCRDVLYLTFPSEQENVVFEESLRAHQGQRRLLDAVFSVREDRIRRRRNRRRHRRFYGDW